MIRSTEQLREFERWYSSTQLAPLTYLEALDIFAAMWRHALLVSDDFPGPWEEDVKADIELARVLNAHVR